MVPAVWSRGRAARHRDASVGARAVGLAAHDTGGQSGAGLLTDKQCQRLAALFAVDEHVEVEATWGIHQRMIAAYRESDRPRGRPMMERLIASVSQGVPVETGGFRPQLHLRS